MPKSSSLPSAPATAARPLPPGAAATIITLIGKGLSANEILGLNPTLQLADIFAALTHAAEVMSEGDAKLENDDAEVDEIIARAGQNSGLSDDEAMALAVEETRAARRERAQRRR